MRNLSEMLVWSPEGVDAGGGSPAPAAPSGGDSGGSAPSGSASPTPAASTPSAEGRGAPKMPDPDSFFDIPGDDELDDLDGRFATQEVGDEDRPRDPATGRFLPKSGEAPATPTQAQAPATTVAAEPPAQAEQAAPAAEPAAPPSAEGAQPELRPDANLLELLEYSESQVVPHLAQMYSVPQQYASHFTPEQQEGMKHLAATLHYNVMRAILKNVQAEVPSMMKRQFETQEANRIGEEKFFQAWPQLKKEDLPTIRKYGRIFAQGNPQAPFEEFVTAVGAMACQALGRFGQPQAAQPQAVQPQGGHMAAAPPPANVRPVSHRPANVTPAANNGAGAPQPAQGSNWAAYSELWDAPTG